MSKLGEKIFLMILHRNHFKESLEDLCEKIAVVLQKGEWQPIETAPKDGTDILLYTLKHEQIVGVFKTRTDGSAFWECGVYPTGFSAIVNVITHWMPLPDPPVDKS